MKNKRFLTVLMLVLVLGVGSPLALAAGSSTNSTDQGKVKVVNKSCPIMGTDLDSSGVAENLTREFEGQRVGFCCTSCLAKWDKLGTPEKEAKLAAVTPAK